MRTLIVGAGALGGYFGARLIAAQCDVTFLVRPGTQTRLAKDGLHLISPNGDLHLPPPPTVLAPDLHDPYDLILLSCKAQDLPAAIADFTPAAGPQTLILPLLNGMAHLATLDRRFPPANVLGGMSRISAVRESNGQNGIQIHHLNTLDLLCYGHRTNPQDPRLDALEVLFTGANFQAVRRTDILQAMWDKWVTIATAAGSTVLMRATIGDIVTANAQWLVHNLLAETAAIATAAGYPPADEYLNQIAAWFTTPGSAFTASMLRDLESGAPIEAHQILGDLLDKAKLHSVSTPTLAIAEAHARIHQIRQQREKAEA